MTKPDEIAPFFSIVICLSYVGDAKNTLVGLVGAFQSTRILTDFTPNRWFLAYFEVGLQPFCSSTCTTGRELMCPSSWKLYVDDFPFFVSPLAHLEPELELFEIDVIGD